MTDPNGLVTTYGYDNRGRVSYVMQNANGVINYRSYTYTADGQVKTLFLFPGSLTYTYTYDAALDLRSITDTLNNRIDYTYDIKGNRTQTITKNPDGTQARSLTLAYDLRNHVQSQNHGGNLTQLVKDAVGNLTKEIDPNHIATASTVGTVHTYDALNRLFQTTDVLAGLTQYTYNINDQIKQVTTPNSTTTQYSHDDLGNLLQEISPDRGTTTSTYDAAGNVKTQLDARNVLVTTTYDALNRLSFTDYPGTAQDITYTYDSVPGCTFGIGRLCRTNTSGVTTTYAYNAFGHRTSHIQTLQGVTTTTHTQRNSRGAVMGHTYPGGRQVTYTRDPRDRITSVQATVNGVLTTLISSRVYRGDGQLARQTYANGITDTRAYTQAGRLYYQSLGTADTRLYGYDYNGNLKTKQTLPEVATYTYDPLDRLTVDTDPTPVSFTYDANGNRKTGASIAYAYTPNSNRLATRNGTAIGLSPNGNVLTDPATGHSYSYNSANELSMVFQNGAFLAYYTYDPDHKRLSKAGPQGYTLYHYDPQGRLIQETDSVGTLIKAYIWADDLPIAQITKTPTGEVLSYLHTDHQNTPRLATNTTGKVIWRYEGNAFGDTPPNEDPDGDSIKTTINLRFPGQYYD